MFKPQKEMKSMLTEVEQLLIGFLKTSNAKKGTRGLSALILQEEDQQLEMCRFLSKNPDATDEEIMQAAENISGMKI